MESRLLTADGRPQTAVKHPHLHSVGGRRSAVCGLILLALSGCGGEEEADAYGTFEATETTVASETAGQLVAFDVDEGDRLPERAVVGRVDTVQLALQREGLVAQRANLLAQRRSVEAQGVASSAQEGATLLQTDEADAQAAALTAQLSTAQEELARTRRLAADGAATAREVNTREGEVAALAAQLQGARARAATIRGQAAVPGAQAAVATAQAQGVDDQVAALDAQIRQIDDRMAQALVVNPTAGTVLTVLARRGEVVQPGSPLYTIAPLDTLTLRAYATGDQLPRLRLGSTVEISVDDGAGGITTRTGRVAWISAQAEFTPTTIQTRDERADLVYAFEIRVPNRDGLLKVGMPGEVSFSTQPARPQ